MTATRKVLLIDTASDRKERIGILKRHGYAVFPATKMEEARSRCMRGGYDLIVVHAGDNPAPAQQFCDDIRRQCPKQQLLLCTDDHASQAERDYIVSASPQSLLERVQSLFQESADPADLASAA